MKICDLPLKLSPNLLLTVSRLDCLLQSVVEIVYESDSDRTIRNCSFGSSAISTGVGRVVGVHSRQRYYLWNYRRLYILMNTQLSRL